jgi:hypothetical protein
MILALSAAASKDIGLIATFVVGIGLLVGGLVGYIVVQIRGERLQNQEYRAHGRPPVT